MHMGIVLSTHMYVGGFWTHYVLVQIRMVTSALETSVSPSLYNQGWDINQFYKKYCNYIMILL